MRDDLSRSTLTNTVDSLAKDLRKAILTGEPVKRGNGEPAEQGHSWDEKRSLPASVLYQLLARPESGTTPRAAVLEGLRITGRLNLHAAELKVPLICHGCYFDEPINLMISTAVEIRLTACHLPGLAADQLVTRGDLDLSGSTLGVVDLLDAQIGGRLLLGGVTLSSGSYPLDLGDGSLYSHSSADTLTEVSLVADGVKVHGGMYYTEGFRAQGEVRLVNARITGQLTFNKATLDQDLAADGVKVGGDMFCTEGFRAQGKVHLIGAHIAGQLSFNSAKLDQGLDADWLQVDGSMYCTEGFNAQGEVRLLGAHIAGQLGFHEGTLDGGLAADGLQVGGDMSCSDGFSAQGEVRLPGAHIAGQLVFHNAKPNDTGTLMLRLVGARVDEDLVLRSAEGFAGEINLTNARVAVLLDSESTWPQRLRLGGFVYGAASAVEDHAHGESHDKPEGRLLAMRRWRPGRATPDVARRLRWIRRAEESSGDESSSGDGYMPQPYTQLMAFYRTEGRDDDARRVAFERESRRWRQLGTAGKAWNGFLRWTVGYGYRPLRALLWLAGLLVVGTIAFSYFHTAQEIVPIKTTHQPFDAIIYTLDRLIPVVSFGLREAYAPNGTAQWWAFGYTLLGWALSIAVIAGLNSAVRRDN